MDNSSAFKSKFLGMPYGTAIQRLRKMILFRLAQRLSEDVCFRCGKKIENISEFSIEHKESWQGISVGKFWDVSNVAFSHLRCNVRFAHRKFIKKHNGPEGMVWCFGCKLFLPEDRFGLNKRSKSNRKHRCICNECRRKRGWEHGNRKTGSSPVGRGARFEVV